MRRLHSLDGLRALAVMLVFAHHIHQRALPGGFIGVDVFFVLSGYLISWLLLREHDAEGTIRLRRFYARRALRLCPALFLLVLVVTPLAALEGIGQSAKDGLASLTYVTDIWANYSPHPNLLLHTWSLSVEEQFYLVWPLVLIVALARGWRLDRIVWALIVASVAVTFAFHGAHSGRISNIQFVPTSHVAEFGSGILLAAWLRRGVTPLLRRTSSAAIAGAAIAALLVGELLLPARWWAFPLATLACWPVLAHLVLHPHSRISAAFGARPAVWLGERSYGFYLWHRPIIVLLGRHGVHSWEAIAIALPATLGLTVASWELVERPCLRLKNRFESPASSIGRVPVVTQPQGQGI